jgi:hypothetical protein
MPDLFHSTTHPLHPARFHTSIRLHRGIPPAAGNPFKFAHLSKDIQVLLNRMMSHWV